jgi:CheY-like chemotaxis protein
VVHLTSNGAFAIGWAEEIGDESDLVALDLRRPGINGGDLSSEIESMLPLVRIAICTGYATQQAPQASRAPANRRPMAGSPTTHQRERRESLCQSDSEWSLHRLDRHRSVLARGDRLYL